MASDLRRAIEQFRAMTNVPAVLAGTIDCDERFEVEVVGFRRRGEATNLATVDDQVHIGSCGKSMTSALYAKLVEAGIAEWEVPLRFLFNDITKIDPSWATPTIDDLLRCRAGVAPNPPMSQMKSLFETTVPLPEQRTEAVRNVFATAPKKPGTFVYSNLSYVVAAAAIERLVGSTFEEALQTYIVGPLAMTSFGYGPPPHLPKLRLGPLTIGIGKPVLLGDIHGDNPPLLSPAGRYHLTIHDWSRFLAVFLRGGNGFLEPETIARLIEIPAGKQRSIGMGWGSAKPYGSIGMQGSNTMWSATALIDLEMSKAAMVVANDGRSSVLKKSGLLAKGVLDGSAPI